MTLVRVWRGQLVGMVGAAAAVPMALIGSLAVLALAGGFGGLSALGQAFSGPALPVSQAAAARAQATARPVPAALAAALSATGGPGAASGGTSNAQGSVTSTASQPTGSRGAVPGGSSPTGTTPGSPGGAGSGSPAGPRHPAGPGHTANPQPSPQPHPTVADRVVAAGTSITSQVPEPAGPAATKALQTAGSTLDSIAPIKSP
jgi:hypothetical protein